MPAPRRRAPSRNRGRANAETYLAVLIPTVFCVLAVLDFQRDGKIDKYLIGVLLIFGLAALGYRVDSIIEKYLDMRSGRNDPEE
jgi:hypothetical protein